VTLRTRSTRDKESSCHILVVPVSEVDDYWNIEFKGEGDVFEHRLEMFLDPCAIVSMLS
jgi:hypothetical protein